MSASCRHVPEASELNGENGSCLEVLEADGPAWEYQSRAGLQAIGCSVTRGAALVVRVGACVVWEGGYRAGSTAKDPGVPSMDCGRDAS